VIPTSSKSTSSQEAPDPAPYSIAKEEGKHAAGIGMPHGGLLASAVFSFSANRAVSRAAATAKQPPR
jgi:hypothetical protein